MAEQYFLGRKQSTESTQESKPEESQGFFPWLGKQAVSGILSGARQFSQMIGSPPGPLTAMLQEEWPQIFAVKPETLSERFIQTAAPALTLTAAQGGSLLPTLFGTSAGFGTREGLEALKKVGIEVPEYIKTPAQMFVDLYTTGKVTGYQKGLPTTAKAAQKLATEATIERPLTELKGKISIHPINKQRAELKFIRSKTGGSGGKLLDEADDIIKAAIGEGKTSDLSHIEYGKRRLMQKYDEFAKEGLVKSVYEPTIDKFNKILRGEEAKLINPKYWNDLSAHDQLSIMDIKAKDIAEKAEKRFQTNALDFLLNSKYAAAKLAGNLLSRGIGKAEILGKYMAQPAFRKILFDLAEATNKSDFVRQAQNLGKWINKYEEKPQKEEYFIASTHNA